MRGPKARTLSGTEIRSSGVRLSSLTLRRRIAPNASIASAMGSTTPKISRQEPTCRMTPDRVGPTAGATAMTMEMLPIVLPRSPGGTSCMMVVISSGIIIAVPDACTTRPTSSRAKLGAIMHSSVPRLNRLMAVMKTRRVGNRSSSQPVTGMTTAIVSMKAVVSH